MKLDNKKKVVSLSIMLAMTLSNCATQIANNPVNNVSQINQSSKILNNSINSISGTTNFGIQNKPYHVKATANDIKTETTVSLIYPADYLDVSLRNITIGTGLTLTDGSFSVNLNGFIPITSQVYVLDATKRIGGASNYQMTLRTLVKWTGSSWQSITTPGIDINAVSTALSIISSLNSVAVSSDNTIGKIPLLSNNASIVDIKDNATKNVILTSSILGNIVNYVNNILADNQDPVGSIYLLNGVYKIKPYEVNGFKTNLYNSKVAMNSAGKSVVVWTSNGQDGSGNGVYAQRYDSTGAKQGSE
ncbi:MAG: hypothetical protein H7263_11065, partial [Candidatus Sericytochromatia bacterium]|nr:hypothetical protein [Candidatus Sericytochromatia bacterium]